MIAGIFHQGSGIGNQLHRYVATRVLASDKGLMFGMMNPELLKCRSWMKIDTGNHPSLDKFNNEWQEKKVTENGLDIRSYDPEFNFIEDHTIIDGEFQDERYFGHRIDEIREWLAVDPLELPEDLCVINFRGGEYVGVKDLFLTKDYWDLAISKMREINPQMKFEVHTDDAVIASQFFPEFSCYHNPELNWRSIRHAKYLILANSSFAILPALLGPAQVIFAPRYWARRNIRVWALPQNYYKRFTYL